MSTETQPPEENIEEIFHLSLNPSAKTTIILIHGLLSSHLEWAYVIPHLQNYHLLIPDIPGHSRSFHIQPSTIPSSSIQIATLIRKHAHGGRAHVVGLSMGGYIVLHLAHHQPALLLSAFATGSSPFQGMSRFLASYPSTVWYLSGALDALPDSVYWWLTRRLGLLPHLELRKEMRGNRRWEVMRDVYSSILALGWDDVRAVEGVRVLAVAGGKQDDVEGVRRMVVIWKEKGVGGCKAVVVRDAVHAWDLQFPELFGRAIEAWVEERELPDEMEEL